MVAPVTKFPPPSSPPGRRLGGVASFNIDGTFFDIVGDLEWSPSSFRRETVVGLNGVHGYSERFIAGYMSATLRDDYGVNVTAMNTLRDVTIVAVLANGKIVTAMDAWAVEVQEVHSDEGTFKVRFESDNVVDKGGNAPTTVRAGAVGAFAGAAV